MKNEPLTAEEMAMLDAVSTAEEHRVACDKIKDARGGDYPPDWYEKMLASGKNDRIIRRYGGTPEFTIRSFKTVEDLLQTFRER